MLRFSPLHVLLAYTLTSCDTDYSTSDSGRIIKGHSARTHKTGQTYRGRRSLLGLHR